MKNFRKWLDEQEEVYTQTGNSHIIREVIDYLNSHEIQIIQFPHDYDCIDHGTASYFKCLKCGKINP